MNTRLTIPAIQFTIFILACVGFWQCKEDPKLWEKNSRELVVMEYILSDPGQFSEFEKLVEVTGMDPLLRIRGPYTLFLPTNEAMRAYYREKNVNSLDDFSERFRKSLILNHLITSELPTSEFGLGALRDTNANGDYVVTEFQNADIILQKYAKILRRDVPVANGVIHIIDKVLDPVTLDVFTVLDSDPAYSIFSAGLRITRLKDTLQVINFPYGKKTARTRFTVLAVADTIYQRYGINSVENLITWCGASDDSLTSLNNSFYRYMEYHCMGGTYYLSGLETKLYPILSGDNNIAVAIDTDYKLNYDKKANKYTTFNLPGSNIPAKNGAVHSITDLLPVTEPAPAVIIFETTDFFDLRQGDYFGNHYMKWSDGENTFSKIHWEGDFLQYYYKLTQPDIMHYDCLSIMGWWSISITFPKVMRGNYTVSIFQPGWTDVTSCAAYIDGVKTQFSYNGPKAGTGGAGGLQKIGEVSFPTTTEHTITLKNTSYGSLYWDYIKFDPIR